MSRRKRTRKRKRPAEIPCEKRKTWSLRRKVFIFVLLAAGCFIITMLLRGCNGDFKGLVLDMPEFEKSVGRNHMGKEKASKDGVNLAVLPDFTVSSDNSSFVIPYPENVYDAEFCFVEKDTGEVKYRTKRIRPGTVVEIPAYSFCDAGRHTYRVEVGVYDGESFAEIPSAVALEMEITKE